MKRIILIIELIICISLLAFLFMLKNDNETLINNNIQTKEKINNLDKEKEENNNKINSLENEIDDILEKNKEYMKEIELWQKENQKLLEYLK